MNGNPNITDYGHETRFKPGNKLGGRTHGAKTFAKCLEKAMDIVAKNLDPLSKQVEEREMRDWIAVALTAKAASGDVAAIKEALDRMEGKSVQRTELSGPDGQPLQVNHVAHLEQLYGGMKDAFSVEQIEEK